MPDQRRLQDEVALVHHERLALVLVDDADPASANEDHLQCDAMIVDPVGHRAAIRDGDVRRDVSPAEPARDQVAIQHAGAPLRRRGARRGDDELGPERRQAVRERGGARPRQANRFPARTQDRRVRVVSGIDDIEPEAGGAQQGKRAVKIIPDQLKRERQPFLAGFFALATGLASAFALAAGALAEGASFTGLAGLGLADAFSTGPLTGASATSLSSSFAAAALAFALPPWSWSWPQPGPWTWPSSDSRSASSSARVALRSVIFDRANRKSTTLSS